MRTGRLRNRVTLQRVIQYVPDPFFKDATKWSITTGFGSATIAGGSLTVTEWTGTIEAVGMATPVIGDSVAHEVIIDSWTSGGALISYGGLMPTYTGGAPYLWGSILNGAGVFSETNDIQTESGLLIQHFISKATFQVSAISIRSADFVDVQTVYADINPISAHERLTNHKAYGETTHIVTIRYDSALADIDQSWRVVYGSRTFIVNGVLAADAASRQIVLKCSEGLRLKNEPAE